MKTTQITHVAHLVELCVQHGVTKVVISPGSRNAPLIIALDSHPKIQTYVIHDERSAAFFALGLAEEINAPVGLTCTSGSAPINYAPAVSEAYYRNIPLLLLTADRPTELIDQGDGQTIRQKNLYSNFIKADFELPNFPSKKERELSDQIVNTALQTVNAIPKGPVHINIPLAEPLYETQNLSTAPNVSKLTPVTKHLSEKETAVIAENWAKYEKKLLIIGQMQPGSLSMQWLQPVLNDPSVAILVENTSNITDFHRICHCIDRTLAIISPDEVADFAPELLISCGGAVISKKIKRFFRTNKPLVNWRVGEFLFEEDTYQSLTHSFDVKLSDFLTFIGSLPQTTASNFGGKWKQKDFLAEEIHHQFLASAPFSDLKAFELILDTIPDEANLHMSNSSVVRYCQLFNPLRKMAHFSNRGVSGIDGSTSTALGIANADPSKLNVLITGDTSFFYDSNALWNSYLPANFRIIVINNGGGGIFKIIDGPAQSAQVEKFVAPFQANIAGLCRTFGVEYMKAESTQELASIFGDFYTENEAKKSTVLEVDTQFVENARVLKEYFSKIAENN